MSHSRNDKNQRKNKRNNVRSDIYRSKERNVERQLALKSSSFSPNLTVTQKKNVEKLLDGIGTPEAKLFVPDEFQTDALKAIETQDVLVTAPTGSGKLGLRVKKFAGFWSKANVLGTQRH